MLRRQVLKMKMRKIQITIFPPSALKFHQRKRILNLLTSEKEIILNMKKNSNIDNTKMNIKTVLLNRLNSKI